MGAINFLYDYKHNEVSIVYNQNLSYTEEQLAFLTNSYYVEKLGKNPEDLYLVSKDFRNHFFIGWNGYGVVVLERINDYYRQLIIFYER